jgi:hypothetical protein
MKSRRRLRWIIWAGLALSVLAVAAYLYLTDPARLRAQVQAALREQHLSALTVGDVSYTPWGGLLLTDLTLPAGADERGGDPPLIQVGTLRLRCRLPALLRGRLELTSLEVDRASATIVCEADPQAAAAVDAEREAGAQRLWEALQVHRTELPRVIAHRLDVQLMLREQGRRRLLERALVSVQGGAEGDGYRLNVVRLPTMTAVLASMLWRPAGQLEVALDWVALDTLRPLLPPRLAEAVNSLVLAGRVRVQEAVLQFPGTSGRAEGATGAGPRLASVELRLGELRGELPVEATPAGGPRPAAFLRFAETNGTLMLRLPERDRAPELELRCSGQLNGAPATLRLAAGPRLLAEVWPLASPGGDTAPVGLGDVRAAEFTVRGLEVPTRHTHAAFVESPRLPPPVRAAFKDYQPEGRVNLRLRIAPAVAGGDETTRVEGELEALGNTCTYYRFPYVFEEARGTVRFRKGQILFDELCARHGAARLCARGVVNNNHEWTGFDMTFHGENVALDGALYAALPEEHRALWQSAAPLGLCDLVTRVQRAEGTAETGPLPPEVNVRSHWRNGSLQLGDGRRLTHVDGDFAVAHGRVELHDLHGYDDDTAVRLKGALWTAADGPASDVQVEVAELHVNEQATLGGATGDGPQLELVGRADAWGRVSSGGPGGPQQHFGLQLKDGTLRARGVGPDTAAPAGAAPSWANVQGWVIAHNAERRIVSFTCRQGADWFDAAGTLPTTAGTPLALELHARSAALDGLFPQFLPYDWARLVRTFGLQGTGEVSVTLRPGPAPDGTSAQTADIRLTAERMQAEPFPLPLHDVQAEVTLGPGRFDVHAAEARWGAAGQLKVQGTGTWADAGLAADLNVVARELSFGPELSAGLPPAVAQVFDRLGLRGAFDAVLPRVRVTTGPQPTWQLEGRVPLRKAELRLGLPLTDLTGELSGKCVVDPNGEALLDAELQIEQAQLAERPIAHWRGWLQRGPGERWVRLEGLRGELGGGEVIGSAWIDPRSFEYELTLTLRDIPTGTLLPPGRDVRDTERPGRVDGQVYLRGRGSEIGTRHGGGELRVRGASFVQSPVLPFVLRARRDERTVSDKVEHATIQFLWEGSLIRLSRVDIHSRDLRLVGEGTWDMRNDTVRLSLVGAAPEHWPRVAMLSDLLETTGRELIQYRVSGPLSAPSVTTEPLYRLNETLRALLKKGEE